MLDSTVDPGTLSTHFAMEKSVDCAALESNTLQPTGITGFLNEIQSALTTHLVATSNRCADPASFRANNINTPGIWEATHMVWIKPVGIVEQHGVMDHCGSSQPGSRQKRHRNEVSNRTHPSRKRSNIHTEKDRKCTQPSRWETPIDKKSQEQTAVRWELSHITI